MLKLIQASTVVTIFLLGSAALAAENSGGTSEITKTTPQQGRTARATHEPGKTSGPAEGTDVAPTKGPGAAGEPGRAGLPGNKSGPAVMPPKNGQGR